MIAGAFMAAALSGAPAMEAAIPDLLADLAANSGRRVRVTGYFIADELTPNAGRLCPASAFHLSSDCLGVDLGRKIAGAAGARLQVTGVFDPVCRGRAAACVDFAADLRAETVRVLP